MYCKNCHKQIDDHSKYCNHCGYPTDNNPQNEKESNPIGHKIFEGGLSFDDLIRKVISFILETIVFVVVVFVLLGLIGYWFL